MVLDPVDNGSITRLDNSESGGAVDKLGLHSFHPLGEVAQKLRIVANDLLQSHVGDICREETKDGEVLVLQVLCIGRIQLLKTLHIGYKECLVSGEPVLETANVVQTQAVVLQPLLPWEVESQPDVISP